MRIAIVASPRTGQTWLRHVLRDAWSFPEIALHNWRDAPADLPSDCLLGIHWFREPNFMDWLAERDFRIVTLARHPLDVLVSCLHFIRREPQTARWLEGLTGLPGCLAGESPASPGFLNYALSFGAENLLAVTYQWWHDERAARLRYEDMVRVPVPALAGLADTLGLGTTDFAPALQANTLDTLRALPNAHGWQGTAGLWRRLVPWSAARLIRRRHRWVFDALGYNTPPNLLTRAAAERNWERLRT
jgi:hypothetical protein